ncbi:MAG: family 78 glycoside hydrolase catalytic domain [Bacteroidales bacterium]|nr:family 78 glycoside hydrolase catalytic domain [Bacteroidales bacterium]
MKKVSGFLFIVISASLNILFLSGEDNQSQAPAHLKPVELKCEYLEDPLGVDMNDPRFFWQLTSDRSGDNQSAYRIIVASDKEDIDRNTGTVYDSRKQNSSENTQVTLKGIVLKPAQKYYWKVMVWDQNRDPSGWSEPASFVTGLFDVSDWKGAEWIAWRTQEEWETEWWRKKGIELNCTEFHLPSYFGARMNMWERYHFYHDKPHDPAPLLRKEFQVGKKLKHAHAFISGIGYYEFYVNGSKIGNQVLDPGWTNYEKTILYATQDITEQIKNGENAVGVMLGRGNYGMLALDHWWFYREDGYIGQPKLLCRIKLTYEDGTTDDIISDLSWKITGGPVIYDGPHMGEIYDANQEKSGWNTPAFDDSSWDRVNAAPHPGGELKAQLCQPIRVTEVFKPVSVKDAGYGKYRVDAGTNLSGWARLKIRNAKKGDRILLYFGEHKDPMDNDQPGGLQQMGYIAKGTGEEIAECRFSYKGFRYIDVIGYPGELTLDDIEICVVHSDVPKVGEFTSSDNTLNQVHEICRKSLIFNLHSIPTDCPHREKNGWLGDAVTGMEFGMANYDLAALMTKFTRDIFDTQDAEGRLSIIAPDNNYLKGSSTLWSSAAVHVPWYMYSYYGDTRLFEQYWDKMLHWIESAWKYNNIPGKDGMMSEVLNDWVTPYDQSHGFKPGGNEAIASMNFYLVLKRMAFMAELLGRKADQKMLEQQVSRIHNGIQTWCFDEEKVEYHGLEPFEEFIPVLNIMALDYGIVPVEYKEVLEKRMIQNIVEEKDNHLWGGIFAVHSAFEYLPKNGYADLAYKLIKEETWPSFGWMVDQGATRCGRVSRKVLRIYTILWVRWIITFTVILQE